MSSNTDAPSRSSATYLRRSPPRDVDGNKLQIAKITTATRSRAEILESFLDEEFARGHKECPGRDPRSHRTMPGRRLWSPDDSSLADVRSKRQPAPSANKATQNSETRHASPATAAALVDDQSMGMMIKEPETRPISQDQLINEVKGIYAGLVMVESKCIEVDNAQPSSTTAHRTLSNDQWQALIALHRTLLHEHHDFFLASQHPSASPALRRLAAKYAMPARMWRHGIHSFLELLWHKVPDSLEHMLSFIYLAYSIMALLYETVPAFEDTWIECLGDLGRYRMAIEDDDIRDREVWTGTSRHWYSKASDKAPKLGRLYHHLAILARPDGLQQLDCYARSLAASPPLSSTRQLLIKTLLGPMIETSKHDRFIHDLTFESIIMQQLDDHIARSSTGWQSFGHLTAMAFSDTILKTPLLGNREPSSQLTRQLPLERLKALLECDHQDILIQLSDRSSIHLSALQDTGLSHTRRSSERLEDIHQWNHAPRRSDPGDRQALEDGAFGNAMVQALDTLLSTVWKVMIALLSELIQLGKLHTTEHGCGSSIKTTTHCRSWDHASPRPFPEDYSIRGCVFAEQYFPTKWFGDGDLGNEETTEAESYFETCPRKKPWTMWLNCRCFGASLHETKADAKQPGRDPPYKRPLGVSLLRVSTNG
jgi:hypothetical protein